MNIFLALVPLILLSDATIPYKNALLSIERVIETYVQTRVYWTKDRVKCGNGLYGFYDIENDKIFICRKEHGSDHDEIISTLKHEGWHAVQIKCNRKRALFTDNEIISNLRARDIKSLIHYPQIQKRLEGEARLVELMDTQKYIRTVMSRCKDAEFMRNL